MDRLTSGTIQFNAAQLQSLHSLFTEEETKLTAIGEQILYKVEEEIQTIKDNLFDNAVRNIVKFNEDVAEGMAAMTDERFNEILKLVEHNNSIPVSAEVYAEQVKAARERYHQANSHDEDHAKRETIKEAMRRKPLDS